MKRQVFRGGVIATCLVLGVVATGHVASATYAPSPVRSLNVSNVLQNARKVTLAWQAPSNAATVPISGYNVMFRCTASPKTSVCNGKWQSVADGFYALTDDASPTDTYSVTYTLPLGTGGKVVTIKVEPVGDDDEGKVGTASLGTVTVIDKPTLTSSPLYLASTAKKRITVRINSGAIVSNNGSSGYSYVVKYSRNNKDWFSVTAPAGGWSIGGSSKYQAVGSSGVRYYFRLELSSNAGTTTSPLQSVVSR